MKKTVPVLVAFVFFSLAFFGGVNAEAPQGQRFKKVILLVFENTDYAIAAKQVDFHELTRQGALFTQVTAEGHPSQGNYIAMVAGSDFDIHDDSNIDLKQSHLGDLLEKAGLDWRVYAEDYPGNCFTGAASGLYVRKHTPFMSFPSVTTNPVRCQKIVSAAQFDQDVKSGRLADFSMFIPNLKNDGHDTGVNYAGEWLTTKFGGLLKNRAAMPDVLFIITFDESGSSSSNQIFTALVGNSVISGSKNNQSMGHAAFLKLVEDEYNLGNLGRSDSTSPKIEGIWK